MSGPIVKVEQGELQGVIVHEKLFVFKGIPYAKPPVGELRFSIPVPPEPWQGIRDATINANVCPQYDLETNSIIGSEDCLYLNVSTPKLGSEGLLPVMVYIHGGGFVFGNGTDESLNGADYLVEKDVVVVSFNYRLGILGFFSLDRKDAPGNMGLRDQVEALKWVQKNIKQFGGDPSNVTIFGISAGGASVEYLLLSPMAKGLFHKAIAQSGSTLLPWAQTNEYRDLTTKILSMKQVECPELNLNTDEDILQFLKEMPIQNLVLSFMAGRTQMINQHGLYFGYVPIIEKPKDWEPFLDTSPYELLLRGEFTKVPFMTGFCSREGLVMTSPIGEETFKNFLKDKDPENYLKQYFQINDDETSEVVSKLKEVYPAEANDEPDGFAIDFFSDLNCTGAIYTVASYITKHNSSVYLYEFSYDGNLNYVKVKYGINRKGACHADDWGYILKTDDLMNQTVSKTDLLVRERLIQMWTNFAKHGTPTPATNEIITTQWEPVGTNMSYLFIDENLSMKHEPYPERTQLFKYLYDNYSKNI